MSWYQQKPPPELKKRRGKKRTGWGWVAAALFPTITAAVEPKRKEWTDEYREEAYRDAYELSEDAE
jgi:hypothetical protein